MRIVLAPLARVACRNLIGYYVNLHRLKEFVVQSSYYNVSLSQNCPPRRSQARIRRKFSEVSSPTYTPKRSNKDNKKTKNKKNKRELSAFRSPFAEGRLVEEQPELEQLLRTVWAEALKVARDPGAACAVF